MPEELEYEEIMEINKRGEIKECLDDGSPSLYLAISPKYKRRINGDADIILFQDVHSANISYNILTHLYDAKSGNINFRKRQPAILSSRSDTVQVKLNSIILGCTHDKFKAHKQ